MEWPEWVVHYVDADFSKVFQNKCPRSKAMDFKDSRKEEQTKTFFCYPELLEEIFSNTFIFLS